MSKRIFPPSSDRPLDRLASFFAIRYSPFAILFQPLVVPDGNSACKLETCLNSKTPTPVFHPAKAENSQNSAQFSQPFFFLNSTFPATAHLSHAPRTNGSKGDAAHFESPEKP